MSDRRSEGIEQKRLEDRIERYREWLETCESRYNELESKLDGLIDRLDNGIRYDEENNQYILVWTQRELDEARQEAHRLVKHFSTLPVDEEG